MGEAEADARTQVTANAGKIIASGAATLAGALYIELGATVDVDSTVTVCEYASYSGSFSATASGSVNAPLLKRDVLAEDEWEMAYTNEKAVAKKTASGSSATVALPSMLLMTLLAVFVGFNSQY